MFLNNNIDFFLSREDLLISFSEIITQLKSIEKKDEIKFNIISSFSNNNNLIVLDNITIDKLPKFNQIINNQLFIIGEPSNETFFNLTENYVNYETINEPINLLRLLKKLKNFVKQKNNFLSEIKNFKQFNYSFQLNTIFANNTSLYLTDKENEIFKILLDNKNYPLSKKQLLSKVWNYAADIDTHTLETHIYTLRQKINRKLKLQNIIIHEEEGYSINLIT